MSELGVTGMRLQPAAITRNGIQNLDLENEGGCDWSLTHPAPPGVRQPRVNIFTLLKREYPRSLGRL